MEYKAYLKQNGEGCDYTIGCAQTVISIDAQNILEAKQKLYQKIKEEYSCEIDFCEIYEINQIVLCDLGEIFTENLELENQRVEEHERKEFERLKAKFGTF